MLFDEVTSALDPELVGEVLNVIRDLAAHTRMTMLLVTHEMGFAREISNRIIFFDGGRIVEEDESNRLFNNPQNPRTRTLPPSFVTDGAPGTGSRAVRRRG